MIYSSHRLGVRGCPCGGRYGRPTLDDVVRYDRAAHQQCEREDHEHGATFPAKAVTTGNNIPIPIRVRQVAVGSVLSMAIRRAA